MGCVGFKISSASYPPQNEGVPHLSNDASLYWARIERQRDEALKRLAKNPDPSKWEVIRSEQIGDYLIVMLRYPNCQNYEGKKIMMYKGISLADLVSQKLIDPHFSEHPDYASPIARFAPTDEGWGMAENLAYYMG